MTLLSIRWDEAFRVIIRGIQFKSEFKDDLLEILLFLILVHQWLPDSLQAISFKFAITYFTDVSEPILNLFFSKSCLPGKIYFIDGFQVGMFYVFQKPSLQIWCWLLRKRSFLSHSPMALLLTITIVRVSAGFKGLLDDLLLVWSLIWVKVVFWLNRVIGFSNVTKINRCALHILVTESVRASCVTLSRINFRNFFL